MSIGWYIVPYKRDTSLPGTIRRYCAMDDYTQEIIYTYGGNWTETEVLGNRAIVKVRAPAAVLTALNSVAGFKRIPKDRLDDSLVDLPTGVKQALRNELVDMGYTVAEVQERFGDDIGQYTLRDVLRFAARRRLKPRYESSTDTIYVDGIVQACRSVESIDREVTE